MRFSKAFMRDMIETRIAQIQAVYHFDPNNGTAQLTGHMDLEKQRCYGAYDALNNLLEEIQ